MEAKQLNERPLGKESGFTVSVWLCKDDNPLHADEFETRIAEADSDRVVWAETFQSYAEANEAYDHPIMLVPTVEPIPWH